MQVVSNPSNTDPAGRDDEASHEMDHGCLDSCATQLAVVANIGEGPRIEVVDEVQRQGVCGVCGWRRELPHHGSDWRRSNLTEARLRHDEGGPARRLSRMVARRRGRLRIRHQTRNESQGLKLGQWELRSPGRVRVRESIVQAGAPLAWPMPDMRLPTKMGDWPSREGTFNTSYEYRRRGETKESEGSAVQQWSHADDPGRGSLDSIRPVAG